MRHETTHLFKEEHTMQYRTLGRTGIQVGEIGMGCEGYAGKSDAQVKELLDIMEAAGANCLDCYEIGRAHV